MNGPLVIPSWRPHDFLPTCPSHVHFLYMTWSWLVHNLFTSWSQLVNELFMTCSWLVYDLLLTCSWLVHNHNLFLTCSCLVHYFFLLPWFIHYSFMTCSQLFRTCSWIVYKIVNDCLWLVHDLLITYYLLLTCSRLVRDTGCFFSPVKSNFI